MNAQPDRLRETSLAYFGQMAASISHEIKNSLAIINENAGLMEDLSIMAKSGHPLDPERITTLSGKVIDQIKRADGIIKKMNRFAHTVDEPLSQINLVEMLELTISLGQRTAASYGVTIESTVPASPISIRTNAFLLMNLMWIVMKFCCPIINKTKILKVSLLESGPQIRIRFENLKDLKKQDADNLLLKNKSAAPLLEKLNTAFQIDHNNDIIEMVITPILRTEPFETSDLSA